MNGGGPERPSHDWNLRRFQPQTWERLAVELRTDHADERKPPKIPKARASESFQMNEHIYTGRVVPPNYPGTEALALRTHLMWVFICTLYYILS